MSKNLIKTIQNTAFQNELWARGSKLVLGVSGGPDSVCLLEVMAKIAPKAGLELIVAHVNYGLRGKDSDKDEEFVKELAEKYRMKIAVFSKAQFSDFLKLNFRKKISENELRKARYEFFEKVRKENKLDLIAVAHNADDQVETFLMRVIRGAGLRGMSSMQYKNEKIIRPLLGITRKEILEYLKNNNLKFRIDKTNKSNIFFRNKVRNKLIPYLEKNFNPRIKKTITDSVSSIAEDLDLIEGIVDKTYMTNKTVFLSVKKLLKLHPALQRRIVLRKISEVKMDMKDIEMAHVGEILKVLKSTKGKMQVVVLKGLKLIRKGDKVIISKLKIKSAKRKIKIG